MFDSVDAKKLGKYAVGKTLGSGMFKVKLVRDEMTRENYAAKICKDSFSKYKLAKEASVLSELNRAGVANIVKMIEYVEPDQGAQRKAGLKENLSTYQCKAAIILELAANDTIFEYVLASKGFEERLAYSYFKELITTVSNIHNLGFVHRDIKLENILIDSDYNMKLADFGFARSFDDSNKDKMLTRLGTEYYIAPEMRREDPYSGVKIDVFSCGVVLFIMIFGRPPFRQASSIDPLYKYFSDEQPEKFWDKVERKLNGGKEYSMTLKLLLNDLLAADPEKRPTAGKVLEYEWMQQQVYSKEEAATSMMTKKKPSNNTIGRA